MDRMLADFAKEHGYRINVKMRLRDVIDVEDLPLSAKERNFAFTSHLDFVAVDTSTHLPVIAIEYDGPQHLTDYKQIERDRIKDALCEAAELPLLRIDNLFTRKEGRWRVLTYILWAHEMGKAYYEAVGDRPMSEDDGPEHEQERVGRRGGHSHRRVPHTCTDATALAGMTSHHLTSAA